MSFGVLPQAIEDIESIISYIKVDNLAAAEQWLDKLYRLCGSLSEKPRMGLPIPDINNHVHVFPFGKYLVFYHIGTHSVDIVRVVHAMRNMDNML
jgi:toxin ParE1/3/4